MGTFCFGARCVYKRKEIPPPIFWGRLFETISGYFPNPAIPPYNIRTLHFVECRLCRSQYSVGCDSGGGPIILEPLLRRHTFLLGTPPARWAGGGPTNRWPNEQWSDTKIFPDVILCWYREPMRQNESQETRFNDFSALAQEVDKTSPRRLDLMIFEPWIQESTKQWHSWAPNDPEYCFWDTLKMLLGNQKYRFYPMNQSFFYMSAKSHQEPPWAPRELPGANRTFPEHQWAAITSALVLAKWTILENTWFCKFFWQSWNAIWPAREHHLRK